MNISITETGAITASSTNNSKAIQAAIDKVHSAGGGTVTVPAGQTFMTGSLELKSHVTLHLEPGAVLLASPDINDYWGIADSDAFKRADFARYWIYAHEAENISITGTGTLDANSPAFTLERLPERTVPKNPRAQSVVLIGCKKIRVHDISICNAPSWALRPAGCDDVVIDGVSILSDLGLVNSDGIDPDCSRNVRISNCLIEAGDDGICLKTREEFAQKYGPCENITVTNCTVRSSCAALRIGTESFAPIRNVVFSNCIVYGSHRGIVIDGRDSSLIENIIFSNIQIETVLSHPVWWHEGEPIYICQTARAGGTNAAILRNVTFNNININAETGIYVQGSSETPPENISFDNVHLRIMRKTEHLAGRFDPRPCEPDFKPAGSRKLKEETPWGSLWEHDIPAFFIDQAHKVTIRNCSIQWQKDLPEVYTHALEAHAAKELQLVNNHPWNAAHPELLPPEIQTEE